ncbi:alanine--tRNA ligase [Agitococcus lubricus]|uniref:Alanine--tRNA ligase n=1 Tax=Agitococcus lubricus TaxID=1077255 RepID=A0A2T5IW80_9GAMM|nr:alanine--tRNA ligase [Agitococcus lubricus]PTQ88151.1 alanyl-tRNA synthetase [Agitococcus lubricus]
MRSSADIREAFLSFFESKGHTRVASSSLIPANDPTLLFTNAGMNQFKDCFLGLDKRAYTRAVSSQKCVRAGGKHNDLENVGYTARHHTFFEMLGNFSFGDYFKHDAIAYAWEFLTSPAWLNIPSDKLWVTVYATDDEAFQLWQDVAGVPAERIIRIGDNKGAPYASDNFWAMGDTGPCGPCTEIFYDHGADIWGGLPGSAEEDGDRYIEIWNNVFMQFNRTADGVLHPLPAPSVDTGMGLERISAVMQHVHSNYEIDLFQHLLQAAADAIGCSNEQQASLKVVADHARSCSFLVADGVVPSNEGRGYVLRRIIRRACRHGNKLGATQPFFYKMVAALAQVMGAAYPELVERQTFIEKVLKQEEEQFARTLEQGLKILEQDLVNLQGTVISGDVVFKLYDTYGFPMDLTADIARERNLSIDEAGFNACMDAQRERSQKAGKFNFDYNSLLKVDVDTVFTGYDSTHSEGKVVAMFIGDEAVNHVNEGQKAVVVLDKTAFYAESGGQVGDTGVLSVGHTRFEVQNTTKVGNAFLHHGIVTQGQLLVNDSVEGQVDNTLRANTARNHSATHLLHAALRQTLGTHVQQKGSLVCADYLRFDFSHTEGVTAEQISQIEALVNGQILANSTVATEVTDIDTAKAKGAMALFGEKYGDTVRVLSMGTDNFSVELCGGTHVSRTGDIGLLKITSEGGVAAGIRRIEAKTGSGALAWLAEGEQALAHIGQLVKGSRQAVADKVQQLAERNRDLEKEIDRLKAKLASSASNDLLSQTQDINGVKLLAVKLDSADSKSLRTTLDQLKNKLGSGVIVLATVEDDKVTVIAGVTADLTQRFKAGELVQHISTQLGGKGGGRPDMAQGGGTDVAALPQALNSVSLWLQQK